MKKLTKKQRHEAYLDIQRQFNEEETSNLWWQFDLNNGVPYFCHCIAVYKNIDNFIEYGSRNLTSEFPETVQFFTCDPFVINLGTEDDAAEINYTLFKGIIADLLVEMTA